MNEVRSFEEQCRVEIDAQGKDTEIKEIGRAWFNKANQLRYSYHFSFAGRPIIQFPQDVIAIQELVWSVKPTLIIETGIAHGGSLVLSAACLALLDCADALAERKPLMLHESRRRVIGIDISIRKHNREQIEANPFASMIQMIEGSSIDPVVIETVRRQVKDEDRVMVIFDSNHTHDHVLSELRAYAPLVTLGSYCVVFDTIIEDMPVDSFPDRPWSVGNNPKTAVWAYLSELNVHQPGDPKTPIRFEIDYEIENKLLVTVAPDGFLKRTS